MADMDKETTSSAMEQMRAWLPPTKVPEGWGGRLSQGVACWLMLDCGAGVSIDVGWARTTSDGFLVFSTVDGGYCTSDVKRWMPNLDDWVAAPVEDAE